VGVSAAMIIKRTEEIEMKSEEPEESRFDMGKARFMLGSDETSAIAGWPIGIGTTDSCADLHAIGNVVNGNISDDDGNTLLTVPLLALFEGKRVEVTVRVLGSEQ